MTETLIILLVTIFFFVQGKIRADLVALCALVSLVLLGIISIDEALSGFSNRIVITMACVFIVGGAVLKTGLAEKASGHLLRMAGNSEVKLLALLMLATAAVGGFVSGTGTIAIMLPITISATRSLRFASSRFLMPLAFASSMGGMLTLIGSSSNLVISTVLVNAKYPPLKFFSFLPIGLICVFVGVLSLIPLSKLLIRKNTDDKSSGEDKKTAKQLVTQYQITQNIFRLEIPCESSIFGVSLEKLDLPNKYNVTVALISRKNKTKHSLFTQKYHQIVPEAKTVFFPNDIIYILGSHEQVEEVAHEYGLHFLDHSETHESSAVVDEVRLERMGLAELIVLPSSSIVNETVITAGFREKYNITILAIQRKNKYLTQNIKDEKIEGGDVLLIQGDWTNIEHLSKSTSDWILIGGSLEKALEMPLASKAPVAGAILVIMVLSMVFGLLPPVIATMLASLVLVFTGCFNNVEEAYKMINWSTIILVASMLSMAIAVEKTGITAMMAQAFASSLGVHGPYVLLAGIYVATSITTFFISNTATAMLIAPLALQAASAIKVSPYPFMFAVALGASMCFASPFSTPPNAIVMSAGRYTFSDYIKVGLPLQVVVAIIFILVLPLLFPF